MIDSNVGADAWRTGVLTFDGNLRVSKKVTYERMKGTEVPNPRRSSACDCTCVLTRNRSLSRDSLMLAHALFCSCPFTGFVQLTFSLADFTLSDSTAPIRFIVKLFSLANYTLLFV